MTDSTQAMPTSRRAVNQGNSTTRRSAPRRDQAGDQRGAAGVSGDRRSRWVRGGPAAGSGVAGATPAPGAGGVCELTKDGGYTRSDR